MSAPVRIKRQRTKGWRMPEGAVYVGRPTKWGNPWRVDAGATMHGEDHQGRIEELEIPTTPAMAVAAFRRMWDWRLTGVEPEDDDDIAYVAARQAELEELRGHDLACYCPLDQPCHADILLELSNGGAHHATRA